MIEVDSLAELVERAEVIVSVCPPSEAPRVAEGVAAIGFVGTAAWKHRIGFVPDPPMPQLLNPKLRGIDQKST